MTDMPDRCRLLYKHGIAPAMQLLGRGFDTPESRAMLYAIAMQESRVTHRRQVGGPARGFWQFELGGGVRGVVRHNATRPHADRICAALQIPLVTEKIYPALEYNDTLAAAFARLLLYSDPQELPHREQGPDIAWSYYLRTWRPGKPHPMTWPGFWEQAWLLAKEAT